MADSLVRTAAIRSSEVGVIRIPAGAASVGISVLRDIGAVSNFTNGASGGRARGLTAEMVCSFGGPAARTSDPRGLSGSGGAEGDPTEGRVSGRGLTGGSLDGGRVFNISDFQSYTTEAWAVRLS